MTDADRKRAAAIRQRPHQEKRKPGRPRLPPGERRQRREFTLPSEVIAMAERIGDGNASAGVEIAVRAYTGADSP